MKEEELGPIGREEASQALAWGRDGAVICRVLLRLALNEADGAWALERVGALLFHPDPEVRRVAVSSVGYLVRIHRAIDVSRVLPALAALRADPLVAPRVRDTLKDISQFVRAA
ncbi:MAG TPA: hypothetical protein VGI39_28620 [Polyangiaceae bacterium]|jgi:hypothetical protein